MEQNPLTWIPIVLWRVTIITRTDTTQHSSNSAVSSPSNFICEAPFFYQDRPYRRHHSKIRRCAPIVAHLWRKLTIDRFVVVVVGSSQHAAGRCIPFSVLDCCPQVSALVTVTGCLPSTDILEWEPFFKYRFHCFQNPTFESSLFVKNDIQVKSVR